MHPDFRDLLAEFNAAGVDYLVVGAHALAAHGHVRATKDLDVWVNPSPDNAPRVLRALAAFGAPLHELSKDDLAQPDLIYQVGLPPVRIDVLTSIDGVAFAEAWAERVETTFAGERAAVLSRRHLVQNKRTSGRLQDLADIERLESTENTVLDC
ncbi:MAG TPA: hypothetical protein VF121_16735 [Thermoanaerobaculia bacterium]|nr:hypothetical protein [Thermoanaerobaculia bacterium]